MTDMDKVSIKYIFKDDYNPVYINGAFGGRNYSGEYVLNFYLERQPLPKKLIHEINPDGTLGEVVGTSPDNLNESVIRYIQNGIVLDIKTAKNIYTWLGDILRESEETGEF